MTITRSRRLSYTFIYLFLAIVALIMLVPVYWTVVVSLKDQGAMGQLPIRLFPERPIWENYLEVWRRSNVPRAYKNSVILSLIYVGLTVASSSLSGYAFARFRVRVKRYIFPVVLATMMVPPIVLLIPMYLIFQSVGLLNTYWIWVLWGIGGSAYHIFLFRQFFSSVPADLIDAAKVDGCSPFRTFLRIVVPNSFGVFAASTIFSFRTIWSQLIEPMIYLTGDKLPFSVVLITGMNPPFRPDYAPDIPVQLAGSLYYLIPIVLVFFLAQKYIIRGIITTGLKG